MTKPVIGFVGMTHLGLNSATAGADKGFEVVCFDPDAGLIDDLSQGRLPVTEPNLPELIGRNQHRIRFTTDAAALDGCDVVYVAPDVPTDDHGNSDLTELKKSLGVAAGRLRNGAVLVVLSQVPPGFTRAHTLPGLILYYQVETLIFGRAVERALHPERTVVGCADPAQPLPPVYRAFLESFSCPILPMRYESAELCKISINCCLVASLSVANTLAELCEGIGAVWSEIEPALRLDRRIGEYAYLKPGLGIAGGNLERDLATVVRFSEQIGSDAAVLRAFRHNSRYRKDWTLRTLHRAIFSSVEDPLIAVLGLAYKEDTNSIKNSPSLALIENLTPFRLRVYDPVVPATAAPHPNAEAAASPAAAWADADALVIMTPWTAFRGLRPDEIADSLRGRCVVDPYAVLDGAACRRSGLDYHTLGVVDA